MSPLLSFIDISAREAAAIVDAEQARIISAQRPIIYWAVRVPRSELTSSAMPVMANREGRTTGPAGRQPASQCAPKCGALV